MRVLQNQHDFPCPASILPQGQLAIGALGFFEAEEVAMFFLSISRSKRQYVAVSKEEIESHWGLIPEGNSLIKSVGGLTRFWHEFNILVDSDLIAVLEDEMFAPTPKLVDAIRSAKVYPKTMVN
jgi:hypothetical protein